MLNDKINKLEDEINKNTAPKWAININILFLTAIKDIGNGAIHTNGGDITKQENIDKELLEIVNSVITELLDIIYEHPIKSETNLSILKSKKFK